MNTKYRVTRRVRSIEYAIRDVIEFAQKLERKGREVTYLNIGDPVKFDFDTPHHMKQALIKAVKEGANSYSPSEGLPELKEAIIHKERVVNNIDIPQENIVVTNGVSEGIFMIMAALVNRGDEVLVPGPTYPPYTTYVRFFEGKPLAYRTVENEEWKPDIEDLESKISLKTRCIIIINPNNPCGSVYDEKSIKDIVNLASEYNLPILSDEIYDRIVYEKSFVSTASVAGDCPIIGLNGFSKTYLATGWRLGYLYFHDTMKKLNNLMENVKKETRIRLCANTPMQKAGAAALKGPQDHIKMMLTKLLRRRNYAWKRLSQIEGLSCTKPEGAFYLFPRIHGIGKRWKNDFRFVLDVLENTGVLFVHGSGFCKTYGAGHFRAVFLPPLEVLENSFNLLEQFMRT